MVKDDSKLEGWPLCERITELFNDICFDADYDEDQSGVVFNACLSHLLT